MIESMYSLDDLEIVPTGDELALVGACPPLIEAWRRQIAEEGLGLQAEVDQALTRILLAGVMEAWSETGYPPTRAEVAAFLRGIPPREAATVDHEGAQLRGILRRVPAADIRAALERLLDASLLTLQDTARLVPTIEGLDYARGPLVDTGSPGVVRLLLGVREDTPVVRALKRYRSDKATALAVPAYRILTDRALDSIAKARPATLKDLARISGIGPITLAEYGDDLVRIVTALAA